MAQARFEFTELHMGLPVRIVLYAEDTTRARLAAQSAFERIAQLEQIMSDYRPTSELSRLVGQWHGGAVGRTVSDELFQVLETSLVLAAETNGAFDPTVGPLTALWRRSRDVGRLPYQTELREARARVGWHHVQLDAVTRRVTITQPGMQLDLGGIAKGFILDQALGILADDGIGQAMIAAGGDVVVGAAPPGARGWHIAVPDADSAFHHRATALEHAALSTSGSSAQFVEIDGVRYSHVVDPRTGFGLTDHRTVYVIAPTGLEADGLATALSVLGPTVGSTILARHPDAKASFSRNN